MATSLSAATETRGERTAAAFGGGNWGEACGGTRTRGKKGLFEGIWVVLKESGRAAGAQSAREAQTRAAGARVAAPNLLLNSNKCFLPLT